MKIHLYDQNPEVKLRPKSPLSFETVHWNLNLALEKLGNYAEPDEADFVGTLSSLDVGFKYPGKASFVIHVWETLNTIPLELYHQSLAARQRILGLSSQISNLWRKMNYLKVGTVYGGCDTEFWKPTKPKNPKNFQFLHISHSNIRSGLDQTLVAFTLAFAREPYVKLVVKDCNPQTPDSPLMKRIDEFKKAGANIEYISERWDLEQLRDLYSESHVTLNMLRATSFGLPLLECSACESLCITGDIPSPNEIITSENGLLLRPAKIVPIQSRIKHLTEYWGLKNAFPPHFHYIEEPTFAEYDEEDYAHLLKDTFRNYRELSKLPMRQTVTEKWSWERGAKALIHQLSL